MWFTPVQDSQHTALLVSNLSSANIANKATQICLHSKPIAELLSLSQHPVSQNETYRETCLFYIIPFTWPACLWTVGVNCRGRIEKSNILEMWTIQILCSNDMCDGSLWLWQDQSLRSSVNSPSLHLYNVNTSHRKQALLYVPHKLRVQDGWLQHANACSFRSQITEKKNNTQIKGFDLIEDLDL